MLPINPSQSNMSTLAQVLRWAQSVYKALNGGINIANVAGQASNGEPNSFNVDNLSCQILYIAANTWGASNTQQAFNHKLLRQPIGFIVCYKSKTCDIYSTQVSDTNNIYLATTDPTAIVKILVF